VTTSFDGKTFTKRYDAVAVCCGTHQVPKRPNLTGIDLFQGSIEHSFRFWDAKQYVGKNVVVVGMGESSADIVRDISDVASSCRLLVRSYPLCVPRVLPTGFPADSMTCRLFYPNRQDSLLVWVISCVIAFLVFAPMMLFRLFKSYFDWPYELDAFQQPRYRFMDVNTVREQGLVSLLAKWHGTDNTSFVNKFATKNVSWLPNVLAGKIQVQLGKIRSLKERSVEVDDGSVFENVDAIVLCTGYKDEFAFLPADVAPPNNDVRKLFLHAFNPNVGSSLAFIGFSRPTTGAIPLCSELVARYFALLVSEERKLPANIAQLAVENEQRENSIIRNSLKVRSCVQPTEYMDDLATLIGCCQSPWAYWYRPLRFLTHLVQLNCGARFRLVGPHADPKMAEEWLAKVPITVPVPAVLILSVHKVLHCLGLNSGDIMVDLRKWGVEATNVLAFA
jgi:dimethylaniline monooxygenase (N-oxide forming)